MSFSDARLGLAALLVIASVTLQSRIGSAGLADTTDPMGAAQTFFTAIIGNDAAGIRGNAVGTDEEFETVSAMASVLAGQKAVTDAATAKFPDSAPRLARMRAPDFLAKLNEAELKVDGDVATFTPKAGATGARALTLKRLDGTWKVLLSSMQLDQQRTQVGKMNQMSAAMREVAADITADKYATADAALMALGQKLQAIQSGGMSPATQPSR